MKFSRDKIVDSHRLDYILDLDGYKLLDFLTLNANSGNDKAVLESWSKFFRDKDVPYAVTRHLSKIVLWKEQLAEL